MTYDQAIDYVKEWSKTKRNKENNDLYIKNIKPYTVNDAWDDYILDAKARGVSTIKIMNQCYNAHIKNILGEIEISKLTKKMIESWKVELSEKPRKTWKKNNENSSNNADNQIITDKFNKKINNKIRQRQDSANRILTMLKSALNLAIINEKNGGNTSWKDVKPFPKTRSNRITVITIDEQRALVAACSEELRPLVKAALYTGARYGELIPVIVDDFKGDTLHIEYGKGKGVVNPRDVILDKKASDWFTRFTHGRDKNELMFKRDNDVKRTKRKDDLKNWGGWAPFDQKNAIKNAVTKAQITKITFHELRHTYASDLLNRGLSLKYLSEQLGHRDTRMVDYYYGHIAKNALKNEIMKKSPKRKFTD